jgi:hypothetical protein
VAADLLVRVLSDAMHDWSHVRPEFAAELRRPLCLVLLRNCTSPHDQARGEGRGPRNPTPKPQSGEGRVLGTLLPSHKAACARRPATVPRRALPP